MSLNHQIDVYVYLSNIPSTYRAAHLRNFFSQFLEARKFLLFHFRHRKEPLEDLKAEFIQFSDLYHAFKTKSRHSDRQCAVAKMAHCYMEQFVREYSGLHWLDNDEIPIAEQCHITPILLTPDDVDGRKYGNVPYDYGTGIHSLHDYDEPPILESQSGTQLIKILAEEYPCQDDVTETPDSLDYPTSNMEDPSDNVSDNQDEIAVASDSDEPAEDWERFESLHDDPYNVNRGNKANIKYEDKIELVWEKGGSGLVFHTDERTWRKMDPLRKEEPFDEPASFDWDIDMDAYEGLAPLGNGPNPTGHWGPARDTAALVEICREREGTEAPDSTRDDAAFFHHEVDLKGFGPRVMSKMGWKPGMRLGAVRSKGLLTPLTADGAHGPLVRTGLGYHGPRISRTKLRQCVSLAATNASTPVYIRTIFDTPEVAARRSGAGLATSLLRRVSPERIIKYRQDYESKRRGAGSSSEKPMQSPVVPANRTVIVTPHGTMGRRAIDFVSGGFMQ